MPKTFTFSRSLLASIFVMALVITSPITLGTATVNTPHWTTDKDVLQKQQSDVAVWLSKKYRIAQEPMRAIVRHAFEAGQQLRLEPTLLLAVMAVESQFNPFIQSQAQNLGLMQALTQPSLTQPHNPTEKLRLAGERLLQSIKTAQSFTKGLKNYAGIKTENDGGYAERVLTEQQKLDQILMSANKNRPLNGPLNSPLPTSMHSRL